METIKCSFCGDVIEERENYDSKIIKPWQTICRDCIEQLESRLNIGEAKWSEEQVKKAFEISHLIPFYEIKRILNSDKDCWVIHSRKAIKGFEEINEAKEWAEMNYNIKNNKAEYEIIKTKKGR